MGNGGKMIVVFHGLLGKPTNEKTAFFYKITEGIVYQPKIDYENLEESIKEIEKNLERNIKLGDELLFVGSSAGAFVAEYLAQKFLANLVLINPSYRMRLKHPELEVNRRITPGLCLIDKTDEVLDPEESVKYYGSHYEIKIIKEQGHRFNAYEKYIEDFRKMYWLMVD